MSNKLNTQDKAKRYDSMKKKQDRERVVASRMMQNIWQGGAALTMTGVVAFTMSKVPRLRYFTKDQKVPVAPVIFVPVAIAGLVFQSPALFGAGLGPTCHFFGSWIEQQSWAQPGS